MESYAYEVNPVNQRSSGPAGATFYKFPAIRCYYLCRNTFYFALYDAKEEHFRMGCIGNLLLTLKFFVQPWHHGKQTSNAHSDPYSYLQ